LAWGGMVYIVVALATMIWIAVNGGRRAASPVPHQSSSTALDVKSCT
jgi:hypothetical protein